MGNIFNEYPYTNFNDFNLDYILRKLIEMDSRLTDYAKRSTISFHDPITWDITDQYTVNTMVVDTDGTAYLSVKAVPTGIDIANTEYWQPIFNYDDNINTIRATIAANEKNSKTATAPRAVGDLVYLDGTLYKVIVSMDAGTAYIVNTNCVEYTVSDRIRDLLSPITSNTSAINTERTERESAISAETAARKKAISDETAAREQAISQEASAREQAISAETSARERAIAGLQEEIKNVNIWVTPEDFGAVGDGVTDDYGAFIRAMAVLNASNNKILYIPPKKYLVSDTIPIPSDVIIFGTGKKSEIYFDGTNPEFGTTLMPAGDNIILYNLSVNYYEESTEYLKTGSQLGSVGITTRIYSPNTRAINCPPGTVKHITLNSVYSINTSPLQTEPGELPYYLEDIKYINCSAPNGSIRFSPTNNSNIIGGLIFGCYCKEIGIGYSARTNKSIIIDSCVVNSLNLVDNNITVSNCTVKASGVRALDGESVITKSYAVRILGENIHITNTAVINYNTNVRFGIYIDGTLSNKNIFFTDLSVSGFNTNYHDDVGINAHFTNCYMDGEQVPVFGEIINSEINYNTDANVADFDKSLIKSITPASGVGELANLPNEISRTGYTVNAKFNGSVSSAIEENLQIGTIPLYFEPKANRNVLGYVYSTADFVLHPLSFKITTDRKILVLSTFGYQIPAAATNRIVFDFSYSIK